MDQKRVVIIGGGFGGLYAAQSFRRAPVQVTLLDRRNFHLFQPLLYQVATGELSPGNIAAPLRGILRRQKNTQVLLGDVTQFDLPKKEIILANNERVPFDTLIVATGSRHHYFGHPEWEPYAVGLKTIEEATEIRRRILLAFEEAEREKEWTRYQEWLTFVVVGAGPTGVELAGALGELSRDTLKDDFRKIHPDQAKILLLEAENRVLPPYPPELSEKARKSLEKLGIHVLTETTVTDIQPDRIVVKRQGGLETIPTRTVLWAAGVQASPLGKALADAAGVALQRGGRVPVTPMLNLPGNKDVFIIGDLAYLEEGPWKPIPAVAPVAIQQGRYVAELIQKRMKNQPEEPFHYNHRGMLAVIGRASAVADLGWVKFSSYPAWLAWLFIHLMELVEFENRLLVLMQWAWNYMTRDRCARLITDGKHIG